MICSAKFLIKLEKNAMDKKTTIFAQEDAPNIRMNPQ